MQTRVWYGNKAHHVLYDLDCDVYSSERYYCTGGKTNLKTSRAQKVQYAYQPVLKGLHNRKSYVLRQWYCSTAVVGRLLYKKETKKMDRKHLPQEKQNKSKTN